MLSQCKKCNDRRNTEARVLGSCDDVLPSVPLFVPVPNSPALSERDSSATRWRGLSLVCQFHHVEIARVEIKHCGFTMWVDLDDDPSCSELHMPGTPSLSLGNVEFPDRLLYILEEVVRFTNKTGDWSRI